MRDTLSRLPTYSESELVKVRNQLESLKNLLRQSIEIAERNMEKNRADILGPVTPDDPNFRKFIWFQYFWGERDQAKRILAVVEDMENEQ